MKSSERNRTEKVVMTRSLGRQYHRLRNTAQKVRAHRRAMRIERIGECDPKTTAVPPSRFCLAMMRAMGMI